MKNLFKVLLIIFSASIALARGGNTSGGGGPYKVSEGALRLLIEGNGLKNAMINYLRTLPLSKVEDAQVRNKLSFMMGNNNLENDIYNTRYIVRIGCQDANDPLVAAGTAFDVPISEICFDTQKLVKAYQGLSEEDVMINLASLAFHEHTHHYQKAGGKKNEDQANRIAGYILITAKFVQLPLLKWTNPTEGPIEFQTIQAMFEAIKAKEQAFLAPKASDYAAYPGYQGQKDRGIFRILPREKYDGKLSIRGGGSYYSFKNQNHEYDYGAIIGLEQGQLKTGFAGCDFGMFVDLGGVHLTDVNEKVPALQFLLNFIPASGKRGEVRKQQTMAKNNQMMANGISYPSRIKAEVGHTFGLRSVEYGDERYATNMLVVFTIMRMEDDGSLVIAWKKMKDFPASDCGQAIEE